MFKSIGICKFAPKRKPRHTNQWWMYVDCDEEIGRYYRYILLKKTGIRVNKPLWPMHITSIKAERPNDNKISLWGLHEDMKIEFMYSHEIYRDDVYFGLDVKAPAINAIRSSLGLPLRDEFHITIGNIKGQK